MSTRWRIVSLICCCWTSGLGAAVGAAEPLPVLQATTVTSSVDGTAQGIRYWAPAGDEPRPVLVLLHTWSGDFRQDRSDWLRQAVERNWVYIQPDFRGPNLRPEACGSAMARQDVLDALDWALHEFPVDRSRVYLAGVSGGGHMTMLMAGYAPERFSAATAWVGISDLKAWYEFHAPQGIPDKYGLMILASCGGVPGTSAAVDEEFRARSPITVLHAAKSLPLDLNAGVNDGHTGSVPVSQTLLAYNAVVQSRPETLLSEDEIQQLLTVKRLTNPQPQDIAPDPAYGREIYLRRQSGPTRVTLFEGGHEALPAAACTWLSQQQRMTPAGE